jgi:hypothetical protein
MNKNIPEKKANKILSSVKVVSTRRVANQTNYFVELPTGEYAELRWQDNGKISFHSN